MVLEEARPKSGETSKVKEHFATISMGHTCTYCTQPISSFRWNFCPMCGRELDYGDIKRYANCDC